MADYLLLFRGGDSEDLRRSPEIWQAQLQKWAVWMRGLHEQGKLGGAEPLQPGGNVVKGKNKSVTDGPFMEGKEMIGGYLVCKGVSREEAIEIAKGCPILESDSGSVEVRELDLMQM